MAEQQTHSGSIRVLPEQIYQKIAAGEVIERPASVLRELLDNSFDAGASNIEVHLQQGGIGEIRVIDDGVGMGPDDLERCFLPHATSKISSGEDLLHIDTLGFRGEALASIAASAFLEISSSPDNNGTNCHTLTVKAGKLSGSIQPDRGRKGTKVSVKDLFHDLPARKRFLKSPATEQKMCRQVFLEKAFPFIDTGLKLFADGKPQLILPPSGLLDRGAMLFPNQLGKESLIYGEYGGEAIRLRCLLSYPEVFRRDRRYIYIYVNNRRIDEFGLMQAVQYGYGDYLPGGRFPYAFVFIDMPPEAVDFNIHPAKREARFKDLSGLHRMLHRFIRSALTERIGAGSAVSTADISPSGSTAFRGGSKQHRFDLPRPEHPPRPDSVSFDDAREQFASAVEERPRLETEQRDGSIAYIGQVFNLFLVATVEQSLYIVDQHAAHERFLFNRLAASPPTAQRLLIPHQFETGDDLSVILEESIEMLRKAGIELEKGEGTIWQLVSIPSLPRITADGIVSFLKSPGLSPEFLQKELLADLACKASIQDGEILEKSSALDLLHKALALPEPRCPHGRPIWHRLEKEDLFRFVGRIV